MENLYFENENSYTTTIPPGDMCNNITEILTKQIKQEIEGKCINEGYIKRDSIRIIKRSVGRIMDMQFNGNIIYNIIYTAGVCNPHEGMVLKCYVENINKMGIMAYIKDDNSPLNILLAKQHHQDNDYFTELRENDEIFVSILGKRFEFGDEKISIIGRLIDKPDDFKNSTKEKEPMVEEKVEGVTDIIYSNKIKTYKWLSNFNINTFNYKDRNYISIEHAFNAQKNDDDDFKDLFTLETDTYIGDLPNFAKKTGNKTNMKKMKKKLKEDWETIRLGVMEDILKTYYDSSEELKGKLVKTGDNNLIYKGVGVDNFWGIDKNDVGDNNHGKLLMKLRDSYS